MPSEGRGGFSTLNGPYFYRPGDGQMAEQAFYARARHANGMGLVHGGMLSAFMDGVLAGAVGRGTGKMAVTIHLFRLFWRFFNSLHPPAEEFPNLMRLHDRVLQRPAVQRTLEVEAAVGYELP